MKEILIKPLITEKAIAKVANSCYTFKVGSRANKGQIAQAVADLYKVKVEKVNIINNKDEKKLIRGRFAGRLRGWKKAIITLKKGQKIPGFEAK